MNRTRKPRPEKARLAMLSAAQHEELLGWLRENKTYAQVVSLLWEKFAVKTNTRSLGTFYHLHAAEILGPEPTPVLPLAAGVSVTITCQRPGEIKLAVHPLHPTEIDPDANDPASLRASGVEIVALCQQKGEIKLGVFLVAAPKQEDQAPV